MIPHVQIRIQCHYCGSTNLHWSRTRPWEWPLRAVLLRPCRCYECGTRTFTLLWARSVKKDEN